MVRRWRILHRRPDAQRILGMHPSDLAVSRDKLWTFLCGWLGASFG